MTVEAETISAIATSSQMAAASDCSPTETPIVPHPDSPTLLLPGHTPSFQAAAGSPSVYLASMQSWFCCICICHFFTIVALLRPVPRPCSLQQNTSQGSQSSTSSGSRQYHTVCGSMTSQRYFDGVGCKTYLNESSSSYKTVSRI